MKKFLDKKLTVNQAREIQGASHSCDNGVASHGIPRWSGSGECSDWGYICLHNTNYPSNMEYVKSDGHITWEPFWGFYWDITCWYKQTSLL